MREQRWDKLGKVRKYDSTPQGGLIVHANVTRTGVFAYRNPDGSVRRELRPEEEVANAESLATLKGAPLTLGHPGQVTPQTWGQWAKGHLSEDVRMDGSYVAAHIRVQDGDVSRRVLDGDLVELSCGYDCDIDPTPGTHDGEPYDLIQRNIRYNHVGIGPKDWGRAGPEVKLRFDGVAGHYPVDVMADNTTQAAPAIQVHVDTAELDRLRGRVDALEAENRDLKVRLATAEDPSRVDGLVAGRLALQDFARVVLGADARFDGRSDREVMVQAIAAGNKDFRADGKSDDYVRGVFETVVASARSAALARGAVQTAVVGAREDAGESAVDKARKAYMDRVNNAWKVKK